MSVIGPRPGLWNQDILTAERDKYNANDVKPGLTGWAQINGRDELEIPDKANMCKNCYLEVSYVHGNSEVGENCVLSYIDIHDEVIPADVVLHGLKQRDGHDVHPR